MKKHVHKILFIWFLFFSISYSQLENNLENKEEEKTETNRFSEIKNFQILQDGPVNPKEYIVGPGDIFVVGVWTITPLNFQVVVSSEGSVVIPTVGEIFISNITLEAAKNKVISFIKKKYLTGEFSFTLFSPRMFTVTLRGDVDEEKEFFVRATQRVDVIVNLKPEILQNIKVEKDSLHSQRNIIVYHKDNTIQFVDIEKYYALNDTKYNPLLRDGDVVVIPQKNIEKNFIGVYGAVNRQGIYEFVEGDNLTLFLKIARGLSSIADSEKVVVSRTYKDGQIEYINCNLKKILNGNEMDIVLQRGDRIIVYEKYIPNENLKITIEGEVYFPGVYPISKNATHLSEIINLAGGVTKFASLENSKLYRRSIKKSDVIVERKESFRGGIPINDTTYFALETDIRLNRELVITNFSNVMENENSDDNVILKDGDKIIITEKKKTVYVFGQVQRPGHIAFIDGESFLYYINESGGFTQYARESDIQIIKAKTKQWLDPENTIIEDGDQIWIPKERIFEEYVETYAPVTSMFATIVLLLVQIIQITK